MKYNEKSSPAAQITEVVRRLYERSLTSASGGNVSIRDKDGCVWITPSSIDKGTLREDDIICVSPDGEITGKYAPSIELRFHMAVYKTRPEICAVVHAHSPTLVAFAINHRAPLTDILPQIYFGCGKVAQIPYAEPGTPELSALVTDAFTGGADCAIMHNHGAITTAETLEQAFCRYELLDRAASTERFAHTLSDTVNTIPERHLIMYRLKSTPVAEDFVPGEPDDTERKARETLASYIRRAYRYGYTSSSEGAFSCRLGDDSFLLTPHGTDRCDITPDALVRVERGRAERGKKPSNSLPLHRLIYEYNPGWNAVAVAEPPHLMAFAVTSAAYEERCMSESKMILHGVKKIPFGSTVMQPELTARELSERMPVCIVENDCAVAGGVSIHSAFNRLEVAEYGARSLIEALGLGGTMYKI